ncbi:MAG: hypothetical protein KAU23_07985, partial [Anaerolineales bacterium]|nr:hypothetical protein [Anaerolineales bacterium]
LVKLPSTSFRAGGINSVEGPLLQALGHLFPHLLTFQLLNLVTHIIRCRANNVYYFDLGAR